MEYDEYEDLENIQKQPKRRSRVDRRRKFRKAQEVIAQDSVDGRVTSEPYYQPPTREHNRDFASFFLQENERFSYHVYATSAPARAVHEGIHQGDMIRVHGRIKRRNMPGEESRQELNLWRYEKLPDPRQ